MNQELTAKEVAPVMMRIKASPKYKGIGVFALRNIKKGTILCETKKTEELHFVPWAEFNKLDKQTQEVVIDFCAQDDEGYYGPKDLNYLSVPLHMNHSCNGNVGGNDDGDFVAIKSIKAGDELCFDYALVISRSDYSLKCKCGEKSCRKVITGNDWMNPQFVKKNYKHMSPNLRDLVDDTFGK